MTLWQAAGWTGEEVSPVTQFRARMGGPLACPMGRHLLMTVAAEVVWAPKEQCWHTSASTSLVFPAPEPCRETPGRFFCFDFLKPDSPCPRLPSPRGPLLYFRLGDSNCPAQQGACPRSLPSPQHGHPHQPEKGTLSLARATSLRLPQPSLAFFKCHPSSWSSPTPWTRTHWQKGLFSSHFSPWGLSLVTRSQPHRGASLRSEVGFCPTSCHGSLHLPVFLMPKVLQSGSYLATALGHGGMVPIWFGCSNRHGFGGTPVVPFPWGMRADWVLVCSSP